MPYESQAQRAYLKANKPKVAKKYDAKTPKSKKLPKKKRASPKPKPKMAKAKAKKK